MTGDPPLQGQQEHTGSSAHHSQNLVLGRWRIPYKTDTCSYLVWCSGSEGTRALASNQTTSFTWMSGAGRVIPRDLSPALPHSLSCLPTAVSMVTFCVLQNPVPWAQPAMSSQAAIPLPGHRAPVTSSPSAHQCSSPLPGGGWRWESQGGAVRKYSGTFPWGSQTSVWGGEGEVRLRGQQLGSMLPHACPLV